MNKLTIPAILVATVMVAGIFAFMPVQQASTVHDTILAGTSEIRTASFNGNDCKNDADDGTLTLTLDGTTDAALVVAILYDGDEATDAGDFLTFDLNADGAEIVDALVLDDAPSETDIEMLSFFDFDGSARVAGDAGLGPIAFTTTFSIDVLCEFTNGDLDYDIDVILLVPSADDLSVSAAIT